jgi:predicted ATP-dependent serine protease
MKRISLLLTGLLFAQNLALATTPTPIPQTAQMSSQQAAQVERVKAEVHKRGIGEKARVRVTLHNKSQQKGYISRFEDTSFSVTDKKTGQENNIPYADVERIQGGGLSKGAEIGIAVGAGVAVTALLIWAIKYHFVTHI